MFSENKAKNLIIVCTEDTQEYGAYLMQLISQKDDEDGKIVGLEDGTISAVLWNEKDYVANRVTLPSQAYVLFIGSSKMMDKESAHMKVKFKRFGMRFYSLGTKAVLRVNNEVLNKKEYEQFATFCADYGENCVDVRFSKIAALTGAPVGVLASLLGPVGWTGVAVAAVTGGIAGGITGHKADLKKCREEQYSFLTLYSYLELLPGFLKG